MPDRRKQVWSALTSTRVALVLIALLTGTAVYGVSTDKAFFGRPPFLLLVAAFALNLGACTARQISRAWRRRRGTGAPAPDLHPWHETWAATPVEDWSGLAVIGREMARPLRRRHYRVDFELDGDQRLVVRARKFSFGIWGPALFHVGLLLIVAGGFVSLATRTWGSFGLLEGETFSDHRENYVIYKKGVLSPERHGQFQVRLDKVNLQFSPAGALVDYGARVAILRDGVEVKAADVDGPHPVFWENYTFYKNLFGYAPALRLTDAKGAELVRFYVALDTSMPGLGADIDLKGTRVQYFGNFDIPRSPYQVTARFFPDIDGSVDAPRTRSHVPRDPGMVITVTKLGQQVYRGKLMQGQTVQFNDGNRLQFERYRTWYGLAVVEDAGVLWVFVGAWLSLGALVPLYLLVPRQVVVALEIDGAATRVAVGGRSDRFRALLAEEFSRLIHELKEVTTQPGGPPGA